MSPAGVEIVAIVENRGELCREILTSLPRWFGIPESLEAYVGEASRLLVLGAVADGASIGFLALKDHGPFATEAYVLGVRPEWHRQGVGRKLFGQAEKLLRARHVRFFTVKTVAAPEGDPVYGATRAFYEAMGFVPIEVFPTLWHERNPCLFLLKPLF